MNLIASPTGFEPVFVVNIVVRLSWQKCEKYSVIHSVNGYSSSQDFLIFPGISLPKLTKSLTEITPRL